jgi:hypothetical protein
VIFGIFPCCSAGAAGRHHQKNQPRHLQPQLMQDPSEGAARRSYRAACRPDNPIALGLLGRNPGNNPEFFCWRDVTHGLDFNSLRRYNMRNLRCVETVPRPQASKCFVGLNGADRRSGDSVDQQLKQLMKELGEAINESLSDSEQIAEVVSRIKDGGYDVLLVLEATIGVSKQGEKPSDKTSLVTTLSTNPEFKISDQDLKFLKSLRIKIEEEK